MLADATQRKVSILRSWLGPGEDSLAHTAV
jgi:hypothetical protein